MLFNAKSSPHGKTKRQNRRAAHMERQRAPPKGREAENGSRGIDSTKNIKRKAGRENEPQILQPFTPVITGNISKAAGKRDFTYRKF